ncbi:MAG: SulP family inorganic anion transporter, partial [Bacteroidota bacterium]
MNLRSYFPFLSWIPQYRRHDLSSDLMAGLVVWVLLVPQGMAYAMLAQHQPTS